MMPDIIQKILSDLRKAGSVFKLSLLVVLAASLLLTGCSDSKEDDDKEDTEKVETQKEETKKKRKKDSGSESREDKKNRFIVGEGIKEDDIDHFYLTYDSSTDPPYFQRYVLYVEDGKHMFHHEKREGDVWPLTEEYITVEGTFELSDDEWDKCFELLKGGKVEKRPDDVMDGGDSGPFLYLYWNGDKDKYQVFSFESYKKQKAYEELCIELSE